VVIDHRSAADCFYDAGKDLMHRLRSSSFAAWGLSLAAESSAAARSGADQICAAMPQACGIALARRGGER
jgi:hypothetical protein